MYTCSKCHNSSSIKLGKCPNCGSFGTFEEDSSLSKNKKIDKHQISDGTILKNQNPNNFKTKFFELKNKEFKRVYTGGIKSGGMYLLGGAPGIGKSTLILQILQELVDYNQIKIGYFTGEEQEDQVVQRQHRLFKDKGLSDNVNIYNTTHLEDVVTTSKSRDYDLIVIDSIQTIYSSHSDSVAGSVNQVKYCSEKLLEFCKKESCTVFIIGHVTKGGEIAGPKYLEHIVDVVSYLEGDKFGQLRFLRTQKNRFGHTDDSGIFEMTLFGLQPVYDIATRIIKGANTNNPGSVFTIGLDNGRPVLTTVEVLLNKTNFKFPSRTSIGVSSKRVDLVIAILERYLKLNLSLFDVFVNIPGEFKFLESGLDLAIAVGIYGQYTNKRPQSNNIFIGELGLGGQVVPTRLHDKRKREIPQGFACIDHLSLKNIIELKSLL